MRLRYLHLPNEASLPDLLPPGFTLGTAVRSLMHTLAYGITGARGSPLLLAIAFVLPRLTLPIPG